MRHLLLHVMLWAAASSGAASEDTNATLAFPGAEGFGATASGGRGHPVVYVTNLNDHGPGSLREAVSGGNRNVLFRVSGTIHLDSKLVVRGPNVTIAGQTAPGGGVCLRGEQLILEGENLVVRFLRLRPGDLLEQECDALTIYGGRRVMVDHCSMSWSTDSVNDVVRNSELVTVQWSMITEPLNNSVHHKGAHGYGTGWGSGPDGGATYHHNLLAHCNSRSPRIGSERHALVDVRNNVIYNMGGGWAYGGEHARMNYVANHFRAGPNTQRPEAMFLVGSPGTRIHLQANHVHGAPAVNENNRRGVVVEKDIDPVAPFVVGAFPTPKVVTHPADSLLEVVLPHVGAVAPERDAVDRRIVQEVRDRGGSIIDSQSSVGGWPELASTAPPLDTDSDGLPDAWENSFGLDPNHPADGAQMADSGYTHLELYLNGLVASAFPAGPDASIP